MLRFWKRRHTDPIEALLRANRPVVRADYAASVLARLQSGRSRFHAVGLRRRVLAATLVTAVAAGAAVAAGGASALSSGVTGLVNVAKVSVNGNGKGNGQGGGKPSAPATTTTGTTTTTAAPATDTTTTTTTVAAAANGVNTSGGNQDASPAHSQYAVTICHHTGSDTNPWVELTLSPQGAANHLAHHPDDFIVTPSTPCPTKK